MREEQQERRGRFRGFLGRAARLRWRALPLRPVHHRFIVFANGIDREQSEPQQSADGIAVLTGGVSRIDRAMALLAAGKAKRVLITGVNRTTTVDELKQLASRGDQYFTCCVDIDKEARNTIDNATETSEWVALHRYRSIIVVTSNYHMPRALAELARVMPGVTLIPYSVVDNNVHLDRWWTYPGTTRLLLSEYQKYLPALGGWALPISCRSSLAVAIALSSPNRSGVTGDGPLAAVQYSFYVTTTLFVVLESPSSRRDAGRWPRSPFTGASSFGCSKSSAASSSKCEGGRSCAARRLPRRRQASIRMGDFRPHPALPGPGASDEARTFLDPVSRLVLAQIRNDPGRSRQGAGGAAAHGPRGEIAGRSRARDHHLPEGTRRAPAPPDYKTGVVLLYEALQIPCVPLALNSGASGRAGACRSGRDDRRRVPRSDPAWPAQGRVPGPAEPVDRNGFRAAPCGGQAEEHGLGQPVNLECLTRARQMFYLCSYDLRRRLEFVVAEPISQSALLVNGLGSYVDAQSRS